MYHGRTMYHKYHKYHGTVRNSMVLYTFGTGTVPSDYNGNYRMLKFLWTVIPNTSLSLSFCL